MATDLTAMNWSEGKSIKDVNFDSYTWDYGWNVSSTSGDTSHVTYSNENETSISRGDTNALIKGKNDAILSQQLTGLVGGQTYDVSVYAYTTGNRKAELRMTTEDGLLSAILLLIMIAFMEAAIPLKKVHHISALRFR